VAPRANWKGFLKIAEVVCPVALYTATSKDDHIALHTVNRATGHGVHRIFIDNETGKPVPHEDQIRGYERAKGEYIPLETEEIASAVPESNKTLAISSFIECDEIDDIYFDKPYYLAPADKHAEDTFALIRQGMRKRQVAAIAQAVLFRRLRTLLIRAEDRGLIATTLSFDYEVRSAKTAFAKVPPTRIKGEMLELAEHIIKTKRGTFDPSAFHDRYEAALADLVKAKIDGKTIQPPARKKDENVVDLLDALRQSAGRRKGAAVAAPGPAKAPKRRATKTRRAAPRKKAS
jgi:DNA end-binding protein Ku